MVRQRKKYRGFISSFESFLNKYNLNSLEKNSYLRKQVRGPARWIDESLSNDDLTYEATKSLLEGCFSDKIVQQFTVIESRSNLKLRSGKDFLFLG